MDRTSQDLFLFHVVHVENNYHDPRLWEPVSSDKNPGKIDSVKT